MFWVFVCSLSILLFSGCDKQQPKKVKNKSSSSYSWVTDRAFDAEPPLYSPIVYQSSEQREIDNLEAKSTIRNQKGIAKNSTGFVEELEAKLIDIPIPLSAKPLMRYYSSERDMNTEILGYNVLMELKDVLDFYVQEMERLGWQRIGFCSGFESLITFTKPDKLCSISIREGRTKSGKALHGFDVIISIGKKEAGY